MSEVPKASAKGLEERLLILLPQKQAIWPKLIDLCNHVLRIRDAKEESEAHDELSWKVYTNDDGTDDESKMEVALLKDKDILLGRIEVRDKVTILTDL